MNMKSLRLALLTGLLVAVAAPLARAQDSRLTLIRDDVTRDAVRQQLSNVFSLGSRFTEPLMSKALEGVAKKASTKSIRKAMELLEGRLRKANELLAPSPTVDELAAGADALAVQVPEKTLKQMRAVAPNRSIAMELGVVTQLMAKGVPAKQASKTVLDLMARQATGTQLTALSNAVQSDVEAGLAPDVALDLRGRGIMSLLPPPTNVLLLNPRPSGRP